ncbi:helix-turn-helix domain-containing protein [Ruegeria sp. R14_0]|uniref:helix-turn-helix domain-containing protein n=1 Tax=Ruegeria sp. R14_0 TaxID=2821100 RepID=UPI001ADC612C|nr:helix-turn-helix domain-containing protein [Ruegeria sp. R14_0]MBO9447366.1 helix-turn-helix domain-containing protein [Ruegeria sp. R14_0]
MQTKPRQAVGGVNPRQQGVPFPALSKPEVLKKMKHYVVQNDRSDKAGSFASVSERVRNIDVIVHNGADKASAEIVVDFYRALNNLVEGDTYIVNLRILAEDKVGGPLYWAGRTAIFWGDLEHNWSLDGEQKVWASQVINLASRTLLVGNAVMLLAQPGRSDRQVAAVHPCLEPAASELGMESCGASTHLCSKGRLHSANARVSSLKLLADLVSIDHGEHLADELRRYVGLEEPQQATESQVANRLIRRSNGDELVILTLAIMLKNIEDPLSISDLSEAVGTSVRQLQRRFQLRTDAKLLGSYKELRLERVLSLLKHTDMPLAEIAAATGFSSRPAMARAFFDHYRSRPEDSRKRRYLGSAAS